MKKLAIILSLVFVLGFVKVGVSACTEAELQTKITTLMTQIEEVCKQDPAKCQKLGEEMQIKLVELQKDPNPDLEKVCKFYDDFLAGLK